MAIKHILNSSGTKAHNQLTDEAWKKAFETVRPHYEKWVDFDQMTVIQDCITEAKADVKEAASHHREAIRTSYKTAFNCWIRRYGEQPKYQALQNLIRSFS